MNPFLKAAFRTVCSGFLAVCLVLTLPTSYAAGDDEKNQEAAPAQSIQEEDSNGIARKEDAPQPNQSCFGETDDPKKMRRILKKAAEILDGQELYFSTDTQIIPGSTITYYLDDTIFAVTWKQGISNAPFTFSEVKVAHPSQFRRYFSGDQYDSRERLRTTEMSKIVHAVVAASGDFYGYRPIGSVVNDGTVFRKDNNVPDMCYINESGDLLLERGQNFATEEELQQYVDENNVVFTLAFGPIQVRDGQPDVPYYGIGEPYGTFSRAAICQMGKLHYLLAASNIEPYYWRTLTIPEFGRIIAETGCEQAYTLDGGQTATIVMNDKLINTVSYGDERNISDIIYFITANAGEE